ncbi:hypothetical protein INS49_009061 [Diaporthe citri]|uniref:uncharacterized protein n=1 Tax=Diaporthe citri TaxID=83186 RepID=UPI001C80B831|nr:uncharacterized protein INS49_009061 [Diaporthe citri]KAG6363958.1 hypothetical protein INS49_009061 [Diaporthe citri]
MAAAQEKATYTHGHHSSVVNSHARRTAQDSAAFLLPHLKPHHTILDIGCGPGTITADLAELVPEGKVTGVDAVEAVLERARAHVAGRSGITNCTFEVADANALPYADASFDVVFCHQVLQHVQDPVGILGEMKRVAKPGGIVAAREADYKSFAWFPEPKGLDEWLDAYRKTARLCGGEPDAGRHVRHWAKQAGYKTDEAHLQNGFSSWYYTGEAAKAFGGNWTDRALKSDFAKEFLRHGLGSQQDLERISATWTQWASEEDNFIVIPNGEILYNVPA